MLKGVYENEILALQTEGNLLQFRFDNGQKRKPSYQRKRRSETNHPREEWRGHATGHQHLHCQSLFGWHWPETGGTHVGFRDSGIMCGEKGKHPAATGATDAKAFHLRYRLLSYKSPNKAKYAPLMDGVRLKWRFTVLLNSSFMTIWLTFNTQFAIKGVLWR